MDGKQCCKTLKAVRKKVADENGIPYEPIECTHEGYCRGTCPACEAEVRYIEQQLDLRRLAGKTVKIVGLASSMLALSACSSIDSSRASGAKLAPDSVAFSEEPVELEGDVVAVVEPVDGNDEGSDTIILPPPPPPPAPIQKMGEVPITHPSENDSTDSSETTTN